MKLKRVFIELLIINLFLFAFCGCKKESSFQGPAINNSVNVTQDTTYKIFKLADFEQGVLPSSLVVGTETFCTYQILKDTTDKYIDYYFSLVNGINVTWDWYLGELRLDAVKFGNTDSVFHFDKLADMNNTNVSNTYLNFNLGGYSDVWPKAFITITLIPKINSANTFTYNISLTWTGWQSVSIPFNAFTNTANASMSNISNIKGIHFTLLFEEGKNTSKKPLSMLLDNIVVTQNKVYQFN